MSDDLHQPITDILALSEGARVLNVAADTLRRWADSGRVPVMRTGSGQRLFRRADIEQLCATRRAPRRVK